MRKAAGAFSILALLAIAVCAQAPAPAPQRASAEQLAAIQKYIHETWRTLTRSNAQLAFAAVDPKFKPEPDGRWPVYVSRSENLQSVQSRLRQEMPAQAFAKIHLRELPETGQAYEQPGLLYLPFPYVVPGGRFNEMYGWDSY